jgi:hypothetical protein
MPCKNFALQFLSRHFRGSNYNLLASWSSSLLAVIFSLFHKNVHCRICYKGEMHGLILPCQQVCFSRLGNGLNHLSHTDTDLKWIYSLY